MLILKPPGVVFSPQLTTLETDWWLSKLLFSQTLEQLLICRLASSHLGLSLVSAFQILQQFQYNLRPKLCVVKRNRLCDLCVTRYTQMHAHAQFRIPLLLGPIQLGITWATRDAMTWWLLAVPHTQNLIPDLVCWAHLSLTVSCTYTLLLGNGLQNCHLSESCLFLSLPKILC